MSAKTQQSPLEAISKEIDALDKRQVADIIRKGDLLREAKDMLHTHGGWLRWLKERHSMSERTAQRCMKASQFAKSVTVTDFATCKLSINALYLLSEDRYWKKGVDENSRRSATEEVLSEAAKQKVGTTKAKQIISRTIGELHPAGPPKITTDPVLAAFDEIVAKLKKVYTKPISRFAASAHSANDLKQIGDFFYGVAKIAQNRDAA
jgi:DUF3102 family protein